MSSEAPAAEALHTQLTISVSQLAEILGISTAGLYVAIKRDELPVPFVRVGKRVAIPTAPVRELLGVAA